MDRDDCLELVLEQLQDNWSNPKVGLVAAGLFVPGKVPIIGTSFQMDSGKWLHAERNVIQVAQEVWGAIPAGALLVISLSPCVKDSSSRHLESCAELIQSLGIKDVHVGTVDEYQVNGDPVAYEKYGFAMTVSGHAKHVEVCDALKAMFGKYGPRINDELPEIKVEHGGFSVAEGF